jgi:hypothetical protein
MLGSLERPDLSNWILIGFVLISGVYMAVVILTQVVQ